MAIKIQGDTVINDDKVFIIGSGTTEERPNPATIGMFRFNTDIGKFEGYDGIEWVEIQAGFTFKGDLDTLCGTEDLECGSGIVDLN